jgi:hypothetical protein
MKEIELFSSQLGHVAAVGSFLSANAFLGIVQGTEFDSDPAQRALVYLYFISAGVGFGSCMTAAVCSTFVMIWGTQKAFRGRKEEISSSVTKMYAYRRSMVRMLMIGVLTNMSMAAIAQVRPCEAGVEAGRGCATRRRRLLTHRCRIQTPHSSPRAATEAKTVSRSSSPSYPASSWATWSGSARRYTQSSRCPRITGERKGASDV